MSAGQRLRTPFGEARLARYPLRRRETLRAWDAADEYLLDELAGLGLGEGTRLLILNDSFGALAVSLAALAPSSQGDSYTAHWSLRENLRANGWPTDSVRVMTPLDGHQGEYDLVLARVPKTLSLLEEQLLRLKPHLHGASRVIGLGMARQIHTSTLALFEAINRAHPHLAGAQEGTPDLLTARSGAGGGAVTLSQLLSPGGARVPDLQPRRCLLQGTSGYRHPVVARAHPGRSRPGGYR
ncbi:MAG: hypothetical protein AB2812_09120 [Candidatus Sedimenticola endophacoides]